MSAQTEVLWPQNSSSSAKSSQPNLFTDEKGNKIHQTQQDEPQMFVGLDVGCEEKPTRVIFYKIDVIVKQN